MRKAIAYYVPFKHVWQGRVLTYGLDGSLIHAEDTMLWRPTKDAALQDAEALMRDTKPITETEAEAGLKTRNLLIVDGEMPNGINDAPEKDTE